MLSHLRFKLRKLFPHFRLALPPKRWFGDNFDRDFLDDRQLGLQAFVNNVVGHKDVVRSAPAQHFFCLDNPPGPHDSLEESRVRSLEQWRVFAGFGDSRRGFSGVLRGAGGAELRAAEGE